MTTGGENAGTARDEASTEAAKAAMAEEAAHRAAKTARLREERQRSTAVALARLAGRTMASRRKS